MATRSRFMLASAIIFLCFSPTLIYSQEPNSSVRDLPLKAEMIGQLTGGLFGLYLSADSSVVWKPGVWAVGIGAELIVGLSQFDMYALPYVRAEAGWAHLDLGYVLALVRPPVGDGLAGLSAGIGVSPEPFEVGYGRMGFDIGLDFSIAAYANLSSLLSGLSAAARIITSIVLSGRVGLGITYSFALR